jgi:c-di-GMP-binding flagellar brake protein YcgR
VSEAELRKRLDERRRDDRIPARLEVELALATWEEARRVYSTNISKGGLLFTVPGPATMPATVQLHVAMPDGRKLSFESEVRHVARKAGTSDYEIGVQFRLSDADQRLLNDAVDKLGPG